MREKPFFFSFLVELLSLVQCLEDTVILFQMYVYNTLRTETTSHSVTILSLFKFDV